MSSIFIIYIYFLNLPKVEVYIYIMAFHQAKCIPFFVCVLRKIAEGFLRELRNGKVPKSEKLGYLGCLKIDVWVMSPSFG